jgi:phosphate transport system ATP-binding protein
MVDTLTAPPTSGLAIKAEVDRLSFYYGAHQVLKSVTLSVPEKKSRPDRPLGLRQDHAPALLQPHARPLPGEPLRRAPSCLSPENTNILARHRPHRGPHADQHGVPEGEPVPKTIFENVAYGLKVRGNVNKNEVDERVERALRGAALFDEVKDRLHSLGGNLSGGQQQRLCIARALVTDPRSSCSTSPPAPSTPSPPARWRNWWPSSNSA